jgi:alpha-L-fucosidase 2
VAANLGAGLPELNAPYFRLYRDGLPNIEKWTREHMAGRPGICVPETMRFNGPGYEYEAGWGTTPVTALNCDAGSKPYYNARTISTGAEVALWIWQQYLMSNDRQFLAENYPVMAAAARFLLAYQEPGADGLDHTSPSTAHEQLWDTIDPTTDLAARVALYPTVIEAAKLLGRDSSLISQLSAALPRIPAIPRMRQTGTHTLLAAGQGEGEDVIAESYDPGAKAHNFENIGLELVWPYNLIGDTSNLFGLAKRTYLHRPYPTVQDWSFDPIQAARLGLGNEVESTLRALTTKYQTFVNGFANWGGTQGEFYIEQVGVVAAALEEVLVQDYDGIIRVAPAVPASWNVDGIVAVRKNTSVMAQVRNGAVASVIIKSGAAQYLRVRNPWPGETPVVVTGNQKVPVTIVQYVLTFQAKAGGTYRITRAGSEGNAVPAIKAEPARAVRHLGPVQIGL